MRTKITYTHQPTIYMNTIYCLTAFNLTLLFQETLVQEAEVAGNVVVHFKNFPQIHLFFLHSSPLSQDNK